MPAVGVSDHPPSMATFHPKIAGWELTREIPYSILAQMHRSAVDLSRP